ncbi:CobW-like GTP-binding protein [Pseudomonas sp. dw_358]|uniref:CobW family GTP-binding protein n=1 Tax=Pseudomonas sp. dw_358 TaxID=2720083 RepID=UPI001BD24E1B|nr:CobW-like GTP-binding protein [Pseudomonas sp. dw_358]
MLQHIPTHVIAGPLGAGKTTLIRHLMQQRPANERWAVLINEFGQIGLDAALLATADDGIALGEVVGGCLCCVNGAPFQVGLARLLRHAKPDRLFIEPSGLGHPVQLLQQLRQAPWLGVLDVQPLVMVLDAAALITEQRLAPSQADALAHAEGVVMNKACALNGQQRLWISETWRATGRVLWTDADHVSLADLPRGAPASDAPVGHILAAPASAPILPTMWLDPAVPIFEINDQAHAWSIGWRWHPSVEFDRQALTTFVQQLGAKRAKLVIHSDEGWLSANAVDNQRLRWQTSEWRRDSRLELIFSAAQQTAALQAGLAACRLG